MTNRAVMQQALECIERLNMRGFILADFEDEVESAITALREALEQPAQRPWQGLTEKDWEYVKDSKGTSLDTFDHGAAWAADQLMERNT